ncbi:MAG: hypothetical protein Ct9H300mP1_02350 [Planctomycetaceae bacterium]|nr:MAG: hypothetical protein Ct9H300mP1_02350 [Planctomycetaceae bacterium]
MVGKRPTCLLRGWSERGNCCTSPAVVPTGTKDIFRSRLSEGNWGPAVPMAEINSDADDIGPVFSTDGFTLFFCSNRAGGFGGYDLYVSRRDGSNWTSPENLGDEVNSSVDEHDPALAPDGLDLFFASDRAGVNPDRLPEWTATIRRPLKGRDFDLYRPSRRSLEDPFFIGESIG